MSSRIPFSTKCFFLFVLTHRIQHNPRLKRHIFPGITPSVTIWLRLFLCFKELTCGDLIFGNLRSQFSQKIHAFLPSAKVNISDNCDAFQFHTTSLNAAWGEMRKHSRYYTSSWGSGPCSVALVPANDFQPSTSRQRMTVSTKLTPGRRTVGAPSSSSSSCLALLSLVWPYLVWSDVFLGFRVMPMSLSEACVCVWMTSEIILISGWCGLLIVF